MKNHLTNISLLVKMQNLSLELLSERTPYRKLSLVLTKVPMHTNCFGETSEMGDGS